MIAVHAGWLGAWSVSVAIGTLPAQELTWEQLLGRRDLWPAQCALVQDVRLAEVVVKSGTVLQVESLAADHARVLFDGVAVPGGMPPRGCDVLARANARFAELTAEQRVLDCAAMVQRAELWPDVVTLLRPLRFVAGGAERTVEKGREVALGCFDGERVRVRLPVEGAPPHLPLHFTDFADRVREALKTAAGPHPSRVVRELAGKVESLRGGGKARLDGANPPDLLVLYYSAGDSQPCREFTPQLVDFYQQHRRQVGTRFEVVWIGRDGSEKEHRAQRQSEHMPWLGVRWNARDAIPVTDAHAPGKVPHLVVLDTNGRVVADSYRGDEYVGPESALKSLRDLVDSK